jgi:GWxTD domain-containing protein
MQKFLIAAALSAAFAANAFALSEQNTAFGKGPAQYLMTKEEAAQWKSIRTDAEAQAFIDLFWARRDPTPATPANEFRAEFDARVQYADEKFGNKKKKGSLTDRGRLFIVFGPPTRISRRNAAAASGPSTMGSSNEFGSGAAQPQAQAWVYEGDRTADKFGTSRVEINFTDQNNSNDFTLDAMNINVAAAQAKWNQASLTQPNLTVAPTFAASAPAAPAAQAPAPAAAPAAAAAVTEFRNAAFRTAVDEFKTSKKSPKPVHLSWGESVTPDGDYFVPVSLYVPKSAGLTASQNLTFFGVVEDANGKPVAVWEEPVKLMASKDDFYFDKSLTGLPAGKHRGTFGLAADGTPVALVATDMELAGSLDPKAPGVSRLLISNNIYPLTEAQQQTDPYAFGGVKVVPKGDKTFTSSDELWYFIALRNPGLDDQQQTKFQAKLDVEGTDETGKKVKMSAPPSEVPATAFKGVPGQYGIGSAIPLETFKPGDYTLSIKLMDTVAKTSYTVKESFKVVK